MVKIKIHQFKKKKKKPSDLMRIEKFIVTKIKPKDYL